MSVFVSMPHDYCLAVQIPNRSLTIKYSFALGRPHSLMCMYVLFLPPLNMYTEKKERENVLSNLNSILTSREIHSIFKMKIV